jgi:hypothetical protein
MAMDDQSSVKLFWLRLDNSANLRAAVVAGHRVSGLIAFVDGKVMETEHSAVTGVHREHMVA